MKRTINELAVLAANGNERALAELMERLTPFIAKLVSCYAPSAAIRRVSREDLLQTGSLAVIESLSRYDPTLAGFVTFTTPDVCFSIRRALGMRAVVSSPEKRGAVISFDAAGEEFASELAPEAPPCDFERLEHIELRSGVESAVNRLPDDQRAAVYQRLCGVATAQSARPALRRAFRRLSRDPELIRLWRAYFGG